MFDHISALQTPESLFAVKAAAAQNGHWNSPLQE
jgi:hypothetical protein